MSVSQSHLDDWSYMQLSLKNKPRSSWCIPLLTEPPTFIVQETQEHSRIPSASILQRKPWAWNPIEDWLRLGKFIIALTNYWLFLNWVLKTSHFINLQLQQDFEPVRGCMCLYDIQTHLAKPDYYTQVAGIKITFPQREWKQSIHLE